MPLDPEIEAGPPSRPDETRGADHRLAFFLASRFVRARRQGLISLISVISALGFLLGVASLIIVLALMTGFHQETFRHILDANAHAWVLSATDDGIVDPAALIATIEQLPGVVAAEPLVQGFGMMISRGGTMQFASVHGVDPARGGRVSSIAKTLVEGRFEDLSLGDHGRPGIVLGRQLAERLGVGLGDLLQLRVTQPDLTFSERPTLRGKTFAVVGLFAAGYEEYDTTWAFIDLEVARDLYGLDQAAQRIAVRTTGIGAVPSLTETLRRELGSGYVVEDIYGHYTTLFSALRLEKLLLFIAVGLIVLVAAFGVVSTLVLTVMQKVRAIGVLAAMGATPHGLMRIFVYQGMAMGVAGTLGGAGLGVGAAWLLDRFAVIKLDPQVYLLDHLPFRLQWSDILATVGMSLGVAVLATLYPAWKVARLDPVEALRHD